MDQFSILSKKYLAIVRNGKLILLVRDRDPREFQIRDIDTIEIHKPFLGLKGYIQIRLKKNKEAKDVWTAGAPSAVLLISKGEYSGWKTMEQIISGYLKSKDQAGSSDTRCSNT
ncbi:hypothetical protein GCM10007416_15700 [Kroppenstedtia guangzhouensis]|uniref:PH domain-containing protein n=1 Tax=Kroppenstedtia guangzhouensis TaxID=1274356 RepID=A0ABQ1GGL1_9BACL|nr:hypothetical protein GCM10007416_15700 [Kroppenstedtia guangzhouensis]